MRIVVAGGTGFIGTKLIEQLHQDGHKIHLLSRSEKNPFIHFERVFHHKWDGENMFAWKNIVNGSDVLINLSGESVLGVRWTHRKKKKIYNSRILSTRVLVNSVLTAKEPPKLFINASGIAALNDDQNSDNEHNQNFLAKVCVDWEKECQPLVSTNCRSVILRIGVVLDKNGGILRAYHQSFKWGVGVQIGSGSQWLSWIHLEDMVRIIKTVIENDDISGAYNCVAPYPVTNSDFIMALERALNKKIKFKISSNFIKRALGELGELALSSIRVEPTRLSNLGYSFKWPNIVDALMFEFEK